MLLVLSQVCEWLLVYVHLNQIRTKKHSKLTLEIPWIMTMCVLNVCDGSELSWFLGWRNSLSRRFYRAMRCKRGLCCHAVSVCLSHTFVDHVKTNKHIFEIFSPSGSDTILVFPYQRGRRYSDGNPANGGVERKGGMIKWRFFHEYLALYQKRL